MYTIGDLIKKFNLSRSTILYYDKLGLLKPTSRADNNYRLYNEQQVLRLNKIIEYRKSGITLKNIKRLLDVSDNVLLEVLTDRLHKIQNEINRLKSQEKLVLAVLSNEVITGNSNSHDFTNKIWTEMLINLGYNDKDWLAWHKEFEQDSPEKHHKFLKSLNMSDEEINSLLSKLNHS